ncbi:MAG: M1 family metallopeptidase [Bacteroidia bacterium]|nr:M1 family metallopeptidase [Bacteroidia bacterium]
MIIQDILNQISIPIPNKMQKLLKSIILLLCFACFMATPKAQDINLDVLNYDLTIEPDIEQESIEGELVICFKLQGKTESIRLDAHKLVIDQLKGLNVKSYRQLDSKLIVQLKQSHQKEQEISIRYHGNPKRGLIFNPLLNQAHTVYFTHDWMPCHFVPGDKSTFSIKLLLPPDKTCIASGELQEVVEKADKKLHKWEQNYETAPYTYGFATGSFTEVNEQYRGIRLNYYSSEQSKKELKKVFKETPNILQFFEEKSGIPYIQNAYSQVLIGLNYQEMSGLSVFSTSYPASVFKDSSEIHLTAHELAHQWWGNMITCENFGHFWLNEAFAVYMATAFNEHRFGKGKYEADIALYKSIYENLLKRRKDKALVFKKWESSRDNRNVIYYKGAYVLHMLREEMGDEAFWKGIKSYSKSYWGKSVKTEDFKKLMETAAGADLDVFFEEWVYEK